MNSNSFYIMGVLSIGLIFVAFLGPFSLITFVNADSVIATIPIKKSPLDLAFNPANDNVYISQANTGIMSVIDATSNTVIKTVSIANAYLYGIAYNPINQYVYVANDTGPMGTVDVIDISSSSLIKAIPVGDSPVQTVYNPFNGYIYVTISNSKRVDVIDPSTNSVTKSVPVGVHPTGIAYNPNNHYIYVANSNQFSSSVSVIDSSTNTVIKDIPLLGSPWRITFDSNNGNMYVTLITANMVAVIDGTTNSVIKTIVMPVFPPYPGSPFPGTSVGSIAYNPSNNFIYVSHLNSQYITGIDDSTNIVTKTIKVGYYPFTIGYHPNNHNMYVTNFISNTTSVIGTSNETSTTPNTTSVIGTSNETSTTLQTLCPSQYVEHCIQ